MMVVTLPGALLALRPRPHGCIARVCTLPIHLCSAEIRLLCSASGVAPELPLNLVMMVVELPGALLPLRPRPHGCIARVCILPIHLCSAEIRLLCSASGVAPEL